MARICFVELPSKEIETSGRFFTEAFGWQMTPFGPTYACTMTGDVDLGLQSDREEATAGPLVVIQVEDLEASLAAVSGSRWLNNERAVQLSRRPQISLS